MGQFGRTLSFGSSGRFKFRLPVNSPRVEDDHATNWRSLKEQWDSAPFPYRFGWDVTRIAGSADLSIAQNTGTIITFTEALYDDNKFFSSGGSSQFLVVPPGGAGIYVMQFYCLWDTVTAVVNPQSMILRIPLGGAAETLANHTDLGTFGSYKHNVVAIEALNDGDTVYAGVYHQSAAARNIETWPADGITNPRAPRFKGYRVAVFG